MPLFSDVPVKEAITSRDVRLLTGITPDDFQFPDGENPEEAFDELIGRWIEAIASHVYSRLKREISSQDEEYEAVRDIVLRTVAKLVAVAQQQRSSPVVKIDDFAVSILNTAEVTKDLDNELKPFKKTAVSVFVSSEEWEEE